MLGRVFVHNVGQQVRTDPGEIEQGVALGRGPVGGDGLAGSPGFQQKIQKIVLDLFGPGLEPQDHGVGQ